MRYIAAASSLVVLTACGALDGSEKVSTLTLPRSVGGSVEIPIGGPLSDERVTSAGRDILAANSGIQQLRNSSNEVDREKAAIAAELRDDAIDDLDLTLRIARRTSGALDAGLMTKAQHGIESLKSLLKTPPLPSLVVLTDITVIPPDRILHFTKMSLYRSNTAAWESYTQGSRLRIGQYMFRAVPCGRSEEGYLEPVLVLEQPTKRVIQAKCD